MQAVPVGWSLKAPLKDIMEASESAPFVEGIKGDSRAHARVLADGKVVGKKWGGLRLYKTVEVAWTVTHEGVVHDVPFPSRAHMSQLHHWKVAEAGGSGASAPPKPKAKRAPKRPAQATVGSDESSSAEDELDLVVQKPVRKRRTGGRSTPTKKGGGGTACPDDDTDEDVVELIGGTDLDQVVESVDDIGVTDVEDFVESEDDSMSSSDEDLDAEYAQDLTAPDIPKYLNDSEFSAEGERVPDMDAFGAGEKPGPKIRTGPDPRNRLRLLKSFWTDAQVQKVLDQSDIYAKQERAKSTVERGRKYTKLTASRFWLYLALVMLMGVFPRSCKKDYFREYVIGGVKYPSMSAHGMGLTEFEQITRYLHFNDNSHDDGADKMYKVKSLVDDFNYWASKMYRCGRHMCIDEAMFPFSGRAPCKQYLPLKPKKRGLKIWCLNDSLTGYFYHIKPYRGRHEAAERPPKYKVGEWAVVGLLLSVAALTHAQLPKGTILYTDRYFTTITLARVLYSMGFLLVGTCTTKPKSKKKKKADGSDGEEEEGEQEEAVGRSTETTSSGFPHKFAFTHSTTRHKGEREWGQFVREWATNGVVSLVLVLTVMCQQDTKPVGYISTAYGPGMTKKRVKRKGKSDGKVIKYSAAAISKFYNKMMGGVDLGDQYRAGRFAIRFFSRKWTTMFFWNMVQMILVNTYIIEMCWDPTSQHKQYVLELVSDILQHVTDLEMKEQRRKSPVKSHRSGRMEGRHFPVKIAVREGGKQRQTKAGAKPRTQTRDCYVCKLQGITTSAGYAVQSTFECGNGCTKSNMPVALCVDPCFRIYHTEYLAGEDTVHSRKKHSKAPVIT